MDNAIIWLIRLLAAHLVTDFVLQPTSWVEARRTAHHKAKQFWYHILLTALVAGWFTCFDTWWVPLVILVSHGLIDWWKSYRENNVLYFAIDQLLHLLVIFIIWWVKFPEVISLKQVFQACMVDEKIWVVGIALVFLTSPVGILIGMITKSFRDQIPNHNEQSLENAGAWIGILERLIIFFLVLISQYEAIGLLVAAKSIIRLKEGEQKMSEYVLVGTLISISVALLTGYIVSKSI
ncbi:MAG: DUF3307 domain-containing protein [Saprospiraceae bacterium]|nr:DUF3307 domain-containing protein [Saprospiraceae bacterium]